MGQYSKWDRKGKIGKTLLWWWRTKIVGDNNHLSFLQFGVWIWIMSHDSKPMSSTFSSFDDTLLQKTIKYKKNGHTKCTKFPLFAGSERGHGRQLYSLFVLERLIPWLKPVSCCFWWKTLVITPWPDLCQMIIKWLFLFYKFLCKKIYFVFWGL